MTQNIKLMNNCFFVLVGGDFFLHSQSSSNYKQGGRETVVVRALSSSSYGFLWQDVARLWGLTSFIFLSQSQIAAWIVSRRKADIQSTSEQWPKCQLHGREAQFQGKQAANRLCLTWPNPLNAHKVPLATTLMRGLWLSGAVLQLWSDGGGNNLKKQIVPDFYSFCNVL